MIDAPFVASCKFELSNVSPTSINVFLFPILGNALNKTTADDVKTLKNSSGEPCY